MNQTYGINLQSKTVNILDSGNELVTCSSLSFIGQAVTAVLQQDDKTATKYLNVFEQRVSQNQLLTLFEEELGTKFTVTHTNTADMEKEVPELLARGDRTAAFFATLLAHNFADGADGGLKDEDRANDFLGLQSKDVRTLVREIIAQSQSS
jgi:hypothetical protein